MKLEFLPGAYEHYRRIKADSPETAAKTKAILADALSHPLSGIGDPTPLEGAYKGVWKRNISTRNAVFYTFDSETLTVVALTADAQDNVAKQEIAIEDYTLEEYDSVMAQMAANRGKDSEPKVGIFWYNGARNELFGVIARRLCDFSEANASDGRITCTELHEDIWKREYRKRKYHGDDQGPFVGAYQDKPRGRIFYNINTGMFEIAVGKWIENYPQAIPLIKQEFDLPEDKTTVKYAIHWDIGMSWR